MNSVLPQLIDMNYILLHMNTNRLHLQFEIRGLFNQKKHHLGIESEMTATERTLFSELLIKLNKLYFIKWFENNINKRISIYSSIHVFYFIN